MVFKSFNVLKIVFICIVIIIKGILCDKALLKHKFNFIELYNKNYTHLEKHSSKIKISSNILRKIKI